MTRFVSRRTMLKALGAGGAMLAGGASMASAKSHKSVGELEILYEFEPFTPPPVVPPFGELPENIAIDKQGNKYVSVPSQAQIWRFSPNDELLDKPFVQFDTDSAFLVGPTGVEVSPDGVLYSAFLSDLAPSGTNTLPNGVYTIDVSEVDGDAPYMVGEDDLFAEIMLPGPTFPNDIALFGESLLVTDSLGGVVWHAWPDGTTEVWAGTPYGGDLLAPASGAGFNPGANGIQFSKNKKTLYVANTSKGHIVEIPVNNDGSAGTPTMFASGLGGPDGLAMDTNGYLYVAENGADKISRISPDGVKTEVLASSDINGDVFNEPADVTFGTTGSDQKSVYIVNLALTQPLPKPTLMKLDVGVPGLPVRR